MPISNGSFEDAGSRSGVPLGWTITAYTSVEEVASFGSPAVGFEDFAWATDTDDLQAATWLWELALFDLVPEAAEDFAEGWANDVYLHELTDAVAEQALFDGESAESFEDGWSNDSPYEQDFDAVPLGTWPEGPESWTLTYGRDFDADVASDILVFDDPTTPQEESFEDGSWPELEVL